MRLRTLTLLAVLALLAPTAALAGRRSAVATYRGRTAGGSAVTVKVSNGRLTSFKASVDASCGSTSLQITIAYPPAGRRGASAPIRDGAFRVSYRSDPSLAPEDDRRTLAGRVSRGGRLSGTIRVAGLCTAAETYTASRR